MSTHPLPAAAFDDPQDYPRFRDALAAADYSVSGVVNALRLKNFDGVRTAGRPVMLERSSAGRPIDVFIRLFLLRVPVARAQVAAVLGDLPVERLIGSRLVVQVADGDELISGFDLLPYDGFLFAFDRPPREGHEPYTDYVMGIGGSTASLGMQMIRRRSRATLDMGCGCGTLGILASRFSDKVVLADSNPRALALARFNVALNGLQHAEILQTDFFSALQGRLFDLIISNPPFVISPTRTFIYRDGGMPGDAVTEKVVRGCAEHLAEGGFAHVLCNWAHHAGAPWEERLATWASAAQADMLVLRTHTRDPVEYAQQWLSETERHLTTEQMWKRLDEWVAAYRNLGITAMSGGLISLRKTSGRPGYFDADTSPEQGSGLTGDHLAQMFAGREFLAAIGGEQGLVHQRLRCSPRLRVTQHVSLTDEGWRLVEAEARVEPGYPFGGILDPLVMQFLLRMEGRETVAEVVSAVAAEHGRDPGEIGPRALPIVAHLIKRGMLLPVA
ncbi:MAG: Release factor glutamine methyltransferase [Phycisphaerales bacterium]|nr:Release factor glutamine methyltransferase [Phycisphaerales bacterium]